MKISRGFALSCLMSLAATPVFAAGFSLGDAANAIAGMQGGNNKAAAAAPSSETAGLLSALTSQLNITPEQAVGGTGAMLGLAKNKLSGNDYSQLGNSVPPVADTSVEVDAMALLQSGRLCLSRNAEFSRETFSDERAGTVGKKSTTQDCPYSLSQQATAGRQSN